MILLLLVPGQAEAQRSAAGSWVTNVNGQQITLVLRSDGSATLMGEVGRWAVRGSQIILADQSGESVTGRYDGNSISVTIEGHPLRFVRAGAGAARPAQPGPQRAVGKFNPKNKLRGKRVRPRGSGASFVVPRGWRHGYAGDKEYQLAPRKHQGKAIISMTRKMLSRQDQHKSVRVGLRDYAAELLKGVRAQVVSGPEEFKVGGKRAGRMVVRANVNGTPAEGYLAVVIDGPFAYLMHGVYEQSIADELRAGADTILATFTARAPKPNRRLMSKMVGCWEKYSGTSGSTGNSSTQSKYRFAANGTWSYSYFLSVSTEGASVLDQDKDGGTWSAFGNTLYLQSSKGNDRELTVGKKGAFTYMAGIRYLRCG